MSLALHYAICSLFEVAQLAVSVVYQSALPLKFGLQTSLLVIYG